ncbi:class II fructose-1,6-bisphosphate aldolase [Candidatus Woesearchaeota archaeon]|nr:class II fructose-1,6-bisphosphate aldolase [Candidatus Woesearchaeota archaeon]
MLVNTKSMLKKAQREGYAVGAFNTSNLEFTKAIIRAAEELKSPVIIQTSTSAINYAGINEIQSIVSSVAKKAKIPVALHLDHGPDLFWAKKCLSNGYTSVMIDASSLSFKENVSVTKKVVASAKKFGASVEAELGALQGIEDEVNVSSSNAFLTDPLDAKKFVELTGCDSLAVAIGTSHGPYKFKDKSNLDFSRLRAIRDLVKVPLVLHGASSIPAKVVSKTQKFGGKLKNAHGVSDSDLRKAVKLGVCKVNIDSDLRLVFNASLREFLSLNPGVYDPRTILSFTNDAIYEFVKQKIRVLGSVNKA